MTDITVTALVPEGDLHAGNPVWVTVTLANPSTTPIRINKRMAVGYKDHLSREIFITLRDDAGNEITCPAPVDYDRNFSGPEDYVFLPPGRSLSTRFDLNAWHSLDRPGTYSLEVHYQADEPLARKPRDLVTGVFSSPPVPFTLASPD